MNKQNETNSNEPNKMAAGTPCRQEPKIPQMQMLYIEC